MDDYKKNTLSEIVESLPFFIKNKNNLDKILEPVDILSINETQCVVNALVSQYDHSLPYNYLTNKTSLETLKPVFPNANNNLVLNIRSVYGENVARYLFGYKPLETNNTSENYYYFSDVVPTIKKSDNSDYIYIDESCYSKYIFTSELHIIAKNDSIDGVLLSMPIILKHWGNFVKYMTRSEKLKENLLSQLHNLNCFRYYEAVKKLPINYGVNRRHNLEDLDRRESFYCLTAYFLEETYNLIKNKMTNDEIGFILYKITNGENMDSLNAKFPQKIKSCSLPVEEKCVKHIQFTERPSFPPPPPPPMPPQPSRLTPSLPVKSDNGTINVKIITGKETQNSPRVIDELKKLIADSNSKKGTLRPSEYVSTINENSYKKDVFNFLRNKFTGGESYTYNKDKDDVSTIDCGAFYDSEIESRKLLLPRLNRSVTSPLTSVVELKYRLFTNVKFGNYFNQVDFQKRITELYDILKGTNHYFIEYRFGEYDVETFVILDDNYIASIRAYQLYFEILRGLLLYMESMSSESTASIPRENLMYIAIAINAAINNFGFYVFGDLIAFRNYIESFYTLTKKFNNPNVPIISLYSSLHSTIGEFLTKIDFFFGGANEKDTYDYEHHFNYFKHLYLLDIISSHKKSNVREINYTSENFDNRPVDMFWDGVSYEKIYKKFNDEKKYLYNVINKTFFINNQLEGSVFEYEYSPNFTFHENDDKKQPRVCFLANVVTPNTTVYRLMNNISTRVMDDLKKEIDPVKLTSELEKIFGNNVIKNIDKLKIVDNPSKLPIFIKLINEKSSNTDLDSGTMLETILFFFVVLEKMGFNVQKNLSKTNMKLTIKPALLKTNIEKKLQKYNKTSYSLYREFLNTYATPLETLFRSSEETETGGNDGTINESETEVVIKLPPVFDITSVNEETVENVFADKDGLLKKEIKDFDEGIQLMLNSNQLSEDSLYRMIPYYIKEQIRLVDCNSEEHGGADNNDVDIIKLFLDKAQNINVTTFENTIMTSDEVSKNIDNFLKENYTRSLNRLIPFYDNQISIGNGTDKSFFLLKHTLDTLKYMRTHMKLDFQNSIKQGIHDIIRMKQETDIYCYKVFIIVRYIRVMVESLYSKLKIQPQNRVLSFNNFSDFFNIINNKLKESNEKYHNIMKTKTGEYVKNKLGIANLKEVPKIDIDDFFISLFRNNDDNTEDDQSLTNGSKGDNVPLSQRDALRLNRLFNNGEVNGHTGPLVADTSVSNGRNINNVFGTDSVNNRFETNGRIEPDINRRIGDLNESIA